MSLRLRLLLALVPLFVAGLVVADVLTYTSLQSFLVSKVDDQLHAIHPDVEAQAEGHNLVGRGSDGGTVPLPDGIYGEVVGPNGAVVGTPVSLCRSGCSPAADHPNLPAGLHLAPGSGAQTFTVSGTGTFATYRVDLERTHDPGNNAVLAAVPLDDVTATLHQLLLLELGISGGVTLIVLAATLVIVRQGLRPLVRMGDTARSIVATDLGRRVEPASENSEVGRLGLALNSMLTQLEAAFAERTRNELRLRHFISDASHELRTPLTSMQGYAELLRRNPDMNTGDVELAMRRMEEETRRMSVLVDDLLLLARLDQGRPLERSRVDLEALLRDACADARVVDPGRSITPRVVAPLQVIGDEMRLRQVLSNLVRNSLVHTPAGTPVEVTLQADAEEAVVSVIDHGPGIPAADRARIFERFHRADPERSRDQRGSGLGLSIAAAVVAAHRGRVEVGETPGGGATFTVRLPLAEPQPDPAMASATVPAERG